MSKNKRSDFILVFDRYFSKKPNAFISALIRALYCFLEALCMIFCLLGIYEIPANPFIVIILCALFTAGFSVLFSFVKKRIAIPCMAGLGIMIVYIFREPIWKKFTYFIDAVFRALDGYVFSMQRYLWHPRLTANNEEEILFTLVGVICILSLICAASMFKKPSGVAPLTAFVVLFLPMLAAQKLSFNFWLIPTVALIVGSFAASKAFSGGIITRGGIYGGCKKALKQEERSFGTSLKKVPRLKAAELRTVHYSKYFSASICAAAIFTATGILASAIMSGKQGMDFNPVIDFFMQFSVPVYDNEDDDGDLFGSSYFSDRFDNTLSINAPNQNDREVLRVSNEGEAVYLHGDIGIKFDGRKWTSPVYSELPNLPKSYRPFEARTLDINIGTVDYTKKGFIKEYLVELDYVVQTNVAFAPTYSDHYTGFYDSGNYDVYGDFVLRSKEPQKTTSFVAGDYFLNYTGDDRQQKVDNMAKIVRIIDGEYFPFSKIFDMYTTDSGSYQRYLDYVNETYLDVPRNMKTDIDAYLRDNKLYTPNLQNRPVSEQYKKCLDITDYLKNNFTYSLDTNNGYTNPVMTFLKNTKSGHCALFASSMTLMVRQLGLPARYCTGFIAPHTGLGNETTLYSNDLHAWCEVYFEEVGWVLFDPTSVSLRGDGESSASVDSESSDQESSDTESSDEESKIENSEESEISDSETNDSETSDSEDISDSKDSADSDALSSDITGKDDDSVNILPFVLILFLVAIVAVVVTVCVYMYRKLDRQAKETLDRAGNFGDCEQLYAQILEILKLCGYTQRTGEQPDSFFARVDRHFRTKLSKHSRTLLKVAFAKGKFGGSELSETAALLKDLFTAADQQLLIYGRIKLRRIVIGNNDHSGNKQK